MPLCTDQERFKLQTLLLHNTQTHEGVLTN